MPQPSALAIAERIRFGRLRASTLRAALALFDALGRIDEDTFGEWMERWAIVYTAATDAVATSANGYLQAWGDAAGAPIEPVATARLPRPVPPEETFHRPWVTYYTALSKGLAPTIARTQARHRMSDLAATDLQLVRRQALSDTLQTAPERVVGYRRVLGPGENCGLCITASTQRYHRATLLPIHSHCGCGIEPIIGTRSPPTVIDRDRLEVVTDALGDDPYTRSALSRIRLDVDDLPTVVVRDHGELGPVLTNSRHVFTGPDDLGAAA